MVSWGTPFFWLNIFLSILLTITLYFFKYVFPLLFIFLGKKWNIGLLKRIIVALLSFSIAWYVHDALITERDQEIYSRYFDETPTTRKLTAFNGASLYVTEKKCRFPSEKGSFRDTDSLRYDRHTFSHIETAQGPCVDSRVKAPTSLEFTGVVTFERPEQQTTEYIKNQENQIGEEWVWKESIDQIDIYEKKYKFSPDDLELLITYVAPDGYRVRMIYSRLSQFVDVTHRINDFFQINYKVFLNAKNDSRKDIVAELMAVIEQNQLTERPEVIKALIDNDLQVMNYVKTITTTSNEGKPDGTK